MGLDKHMLLSVWVQFRLCVYHMQISLWVQFHKCWSHGGGRMKSLLIPEEVMMTSSDENISALLALSAGNSPVTGGFSSQRMYHYHTQILDEDGNLKALTTGLIFLNFHFKELGIIQITSLWLRIWHWLMKNESRHDANFVAPVVVVTDNVQSYQCRQSWHHDNARFFSGHAQAYPMGTKSQEKPFALVMDCVEKLPVKQ